MVCIYDSCGVGLRYSLQPNSSVKSPQLSLWSHTYGRATQCPLVHLNSSSVQGGSVGSRPGDDTIRGRCQHQHNKEGWKHVRLRSSETDLRASLFTMPLSNSSNTQIKDSLLHWTPTSARTHTCNTFFFFFFNNYAEDFSTSSPISLLSPLWKQMGLDEQANVHLCSGPNCLISSPNNFLWLMFKLIV